MKSIVKKIFLVFLFLCLATFFFFVSLFPLKRVFNIYPFEFPLQENREAFFTCKLGDNLIIRSYYNHGSSVTTSDTNSVYAQYKSQPFERAIWRAYSSPFISEISCDGDSILIVTSSDDPDINSFSISAHEIKNDLVKDPIGIYKGKRDDAAFRNENDLVLFSILLFPGILFLLAIIRILKKQPTIKD